MHERPPSIAGFEVEAFDWEGHTHQVYRAGSGPAVIVLHEVPGPHPGVIEFAQRLVDSGYTVFVPWLFGRPGAPVTGAYMMRSIARVCVAREFSVFADRTSRAVHWLRALAAKAHAECGGAGVGAVGMCFTGGFALAMAVEPAVLASVMSQPAIPAGFTARGRAALGIDDDELSTIVQRTTQGFCALGLRFTHDKGSPGERFETLRRVLGDAFEGIEIDSSPGNPDGISPKAHSVLTVDLVDRPGHPTREALDRVEQLLEQQLRR